MNYTQEIVTYKMDRVSRQLSTTESIENYFVAPSRWRWLTTLKRWTFRKVWAWCTPTRTVAIVECERHEFSKNKLLEMLKEHQHNVLELLWGREYDCRVVGHAQWMKLVGEVELAYPMYFHCSDFATIAFGQSRKIIGIDVMVVPWIDGLFLFPKRGQ